MLQRGARGAVRLGKEVCVHIPGFPTAAGRKGWAAARGGSEGEMSGKTGGGEATVTHARDNLLIYHSAALIRS